MMDRKFWITKTMQIPELPHDSHPRSPGELCARLLSRRQAIGGWSTSFVRSVLALLFFFKTSQRYCNLKEEIIFLSSQQLFFALNLLSNFAMWTLFTRALTASPSTTKATITNTTANFLFTALLGMLVFGEQVAGLWWVGASLMAVGCVLVGLREGAQDAEKDYVQGKDDRVPLAERVEQGT